MISAMVLAAGRSRRMGTQKLLLPFRGKPMVACAVDALLQSPVDQVFVVVGEEGQLIAQAIAGRSVQIVTNTHAQDEMLYSVRCGLLAMSDETDAVVVALGDQPSISADIVTGLVRSFRHLDCDIVVPTQQGKRGHPMLFSTRYREEILTRHEGRGLRGLLDAHPQDVFELEFAGSGVLEDIDLPEDYQRAIEGISVT